MKKQRKIYTFLLSLLLAFSLLLPGSIVPVEAAGGDMAVHFIDVGQGLAICISFHIMCRLSYHHPDEVDRILYMIISTSVKLTLVPFYGSFQAHSNSGIQSNHSPTFKLLIYTGFCALRQRNLYG